MSNTATTIVVTLALCLCSACGFQLRGANSNSAIANKARIYVDTSRDSTVRDELRKLLSDRSFLVVANRDLANVLLRVSNELQSQRIVSVQSSGKVSEFELAHSVNIQVAQAEEDQRPLYNPDNASNRVEVVREYTFDQSGVLGKEDEADILRAEMRQELALQIVLRTIATLAPAAEAQ